MASRLHRWRKLPGDPPEWLVFDDLTPCVYRPGQAARLPLRLPMQPLDAPALARRLADGDRRQGLLLYRPACPTCRACEPVRIDVHRFRPDKTQRRVFRRGEATIETEIGWPRLTAERLALYNRHKAERGLIVLDEPLDAAGYEEFLVDTCTDTIELTYRVGGRLIGVAITDRAAEALSAVYCYFDPAFSRLSPGVYSILKQVALCREWGLRHLYLGLYVADCQALAYKARYLPQARLIDGEWRPFERRENPEVRSQNPEDRIQNSESE
jgi:arginine-tRNA-protein transferase